MRNKNSIVRFQKCSSNSTYYRSVKYRINKTTVSQPQSLSKFNRDSRHHNKTEHSLSESGKVTKFKRYSTINNEEQKKMSYLQTWRTLLETVELKGADCKMESKTQIVRLPIIRQQEKSGFTMLTPLPSPIEILKEELQNAKNSISHTHLSINKIRSEIGSFKKNIEKQLEQINQQITSSINRVRQTIVLDQIRQQQLKMRTKRQLKDLLIDHLQTKQQFQRNRENTSKLQQSIFQCKPFQLQYQDLSQSQHAIKYF